MIPKDSKETLRGTYQEKHGNNGTFLGLFWRSLGCTRKLIVNIWSSLLTYKHMKCLLFFSMWDSLTKRRLKCSEFSSITYGQHKSIDVEHVWLLGFTHGITCSDTMKKLRFPHRTNWQFKRLLNKHMQGLSFLDVKFTLLTYFLCFSSKSMFESLLNLDSCPSEIDSEISRGIKLAQFLPM